MNNYHLIRKAKDIKRFIEETNALHDGYIIAIEYKHNGIKPISYGYEVCPNMTQLMIHIMVTSINDTIVELIFDDILDWKITNPTDQILDSFIFMDKNDWFIWSDDSSDQSNYKENGFYVIAKNIKWRIIS